LKALQAAGNAKPSFLSTQLEAHSREGADSPNTLADIKGAAGVMYCAAADTVSGHSRHRSIILLSLFLKTWSTLSMFFLAMVLNPEHQARAQKEIDAVIGPGRLPEFEDRDSLPYVECILQETLRYPTQIFHHSS
jgi:hypothetical protein